MIVYIFRIFNTKRLETWRILSWGIVELDGFYAADAAYVSFAWFLF
jgi:hypothetical protein